MRELIFIIKFVKINVQKTYEAIFQWFCIHESHSSPSTFGKQWHKPDTRSQSNLKQNK